MLKYFYLFIYFPFTILSLLEFFIHHVFYYISFNFFLLIWFLFELSLILFYFHHFKNKNLGNEELNLWSFSTIDACQWHSNK